MKRNSVERWLFTVLILSGFVFAWATAPARADSDRDGRLPRVGEAIRAPHPYTARTSKTPSDHGRGLVVNGPAASVAVCL